MSKSVKPKGESKVFGSEAALHSFWKQRVDREGYGKLR